MNGLGRILLLRLFLGSLALLARREGGLGSLAKLVVEARHDAHGIGSHKPIRTTAHGGEHRDDDERFGDMALVLVIGILVGVGLALGLLLFGLGIIAQGHRRGDIDLGDAKVLIEGRQHAGLVGVGCIGEHRGGRCRCVGHLGIDLLLRQARKAGRAPCGQVGCSRVLGKDAWRGATALGTGTVMRGQTGAAAVAEHELGMLGAIARTNVCVAIGAERGAVLDGL